MRITHLHLLSWGLFADRKRYLFGSTTQFRSILDPTVDVGKSIKIYVNPRLKGDIPSDNEGVSPQEQVTWTMMMGLNWRSLTEISKERSHIFWVAELHPLLGNESHILATRKTLKSTSIGEQTHLIFLIAFQIEGANTKIMRFLCALDEDVQEARFLIVSMIPFLTMVLALVVIDQPFDLTMILMKEAILSLRPLNLKGPGRLVTRPQYI
jgi:hypothetical protein